MLFSSPFDCSYYDTIILMYCGFADAEFFCGGAAGGPVLDDVRGQFTGPLLDVGSQKHHSQHDDPVRGYAPEWGIMFCLFCSTLQHYLPDSPEACPYERSPDMQKSAIPAVGTAVPGCPGQASDSPEITI